MKRLLMHEAFCYTAMLQTSSFTVMMKFDSLGSIYDPVEAVLRSLDNDAGTTAYAVAITGCPTWYEDTTDAPQC